MVKYLLTHTTPTILKQSTLAHQVS